MLKFIEKTDYQKAEFEQVSPTEISWRYKDDKGVAHSGVFIADQKSNHLRDNEEFKPFSEVLELGLAPEFDQVNYNEKEAIIAFKAKRSQALSRAKVIISTGKAFDADEMSIIRLSQALIRTDGEPGNFIIPWSTADVGTGVMIDCTRNEIKEAHTLAVDNMSMIWSVE